MHIRFFLYYDEKSNEIKEESSGIKRDTKQEKVKKKIITKEANEIYKKGLELINFLRAEINEITPYLKKMLSPKDYGYLRIWEKSDLKDVLYDYDVEDAIIQGVEYYRKLLEKYRKFIGKL